MLKPTFFSCGAKSLEGRSVRGFSLVELMVGVMLAGAVLSMAGAGFATAIRAEQKTQAETESRNKLTLALDFIAEDLREALVVSDQKPTAWSGWDLADSDYQPILYLEKPAIAPDPTRQRVVYYVVDSGVDGEGWRGSHMIYRSDESGQKGFPLVDAIAASPASTCTGGGTEVTAAGVKLLLDGSSVQVCLNGDLGASSQLDVSTRVFVRSIAASN